MSYYDELVRSLGPSPHSPLGEKPRDPDEVQARVNEAARLTRLLEDHREFSLIRLGDKELGLLLAIQDGLRTGEAVFATQSVHTGTAPLGSPGISLRHAQRLWTAFERSAYVDFHERLWPVGALLPRLRLNRAPSLTRNPDVRTSCIGLTWMEREFKGYCERHVVGFAGAEAAVLDRLQSSLAFRAASTAVWPQEGARFFHQVRDNGVRLDANLELIKQDLATFVRGTGIDTLFLSLGGAAKILCYELACEKRIRCVDFGAFLRGLCYLGSVGYEPGRATHSPFFFRLDFDTVMDAVERAFPDLPNDARLCRAHAQLILDLQRKEPGWTTASWDFDLSPVNRRRFAASHRVFRGRYSPLYGSTEATRLEHKRFLHFCGSHGLTTEGRVFLTWFHAKSKIARIVRRRRKGGSVERDTVQRGNTDARVR